MTIMSYQKSNWNWQLQQFQQQVGEWVELQFSRFESALPKSSLDAPWLSAWLKLAVWLLLGLFLTWFCWRMWQLLELYLYSFKARNSDTQAKTRQDELSAAAWLQRSQAWFSKGNYREACRCVYLAMLQRLHDTGIVPHQPSRTDGEYLQLVKHLPQSQSYETLITTHKQLCFGNSEILSEAFEQCRQAYREISGQ